MPDINTIEKIPSVRKMDVTCSEEAKELAIDFEKHFNKAICDSITTLVVDIPEEYMSETYDLICSQNPSVPKGKLVAFCTIVRLYFSN